MKIAYRRLADVLIAASLFSAAAGAAVAAAASPIRNSGAVKDRQSAAVQVPELEKQLPAAPAEPTARQVIRTENQLRERQQQGRGAIAPVQDGKRQELKRFESPRSDRGSTSASDRFGRGSSFHR